MQGIARRSLSARGVSNQNERSFRAKCTERRGMHRDRSREPRTSAWLVRDKAALNTGRRSRVESAAAADRGCR